MLRKQHKGTGQSSGSKRQEDYAKVFERILSGGEIFEGDLPPSSSVSSRNPGKKRGKRETGRKTRERDTIWEERDIDLGVSVTAPHLQEQQLKCVPSSRGGGDTTSIDSVIIYSAFIVLHMFRTFYKYWDRLTQALNLHKPWQRALVPMRLWSLPWN